MASIIFIVMILGRPIDALLADLRISRVVMDSRMALDRIENSFTFELAAGGFGKAPSGKSPSSGKKKNSKSKRKKSNKHPALTYVPYDLESKNTREMSSSLQDIKALMEWLDEEEVEGLEGVEIGISKGIGEGEASAGLRGVFAKRDFSPGEYMVAVPFVSTLLLDEDFVPSTNDSDTPALRADEPKVGFEFWEKFSRSGSDNNIKYKAFLDCLPKSQNDSNFDGTPDFWAEDDIRQLEIPNIVDKMLHRKTTIAGLSNRSLEDEVKSDHGGDAADSDDNTNIASLVQATIQQCCWIVQSRAFTTYKKAMSIDGTVGLLSRVVLIPFIDMINHASRNRANAEMQVLETKEYDESFYALVATQPIRKGTEIKICYGTGKETALEIFCKYGFLPVVEDREKEKVALQKLLGGVQWSTTLEEDKAMLATEEGRMEPLRTILSIRVYAKSLVR